MKVLSYLIVLLVIAAGVVGLYNVQVHRGSADEIAVGEGDYHSVALQRIYDYSDSVARYGWNDSYLEAARLLVSNPNAGLSAAEAHQLETTLKSAFIATVDSLIRSYYGRQMTDGYINGNPRLVREYDGLDRLAGVFEDVKTSERWTDLQKLKSAHTDLYNFGKRNHNVSPRLNLKLEWRDNTPYISMDNMLDYDSYSATMRRMQAQLATRRSGIMELNRSPWTAPIVDRAALDAKLSQGRTAYYQGEQRLADTFSTSLMPALSAHVRQYGEPDKADMRTFVDRLDRICTYLGERHIDASQLRATKNQIKRIYID